jgi:predicted nucleic acid-binding protein
VKYVLDTSVVNALLPAAGRPLTAVEAWFVQHEYQCCIPTIVIAEVSAGIAKLRRSGAHKRADLYREWLESLIATFAERILLFDAEVAWFTGEMIDRAVTVGVHPGFADIAIAATAKSHGLTVLTRNVRHFADLKVPILDPFATPPR